MRRLTRRQKRKLKRIIGETVSAAAIGVALGGLLIFGFATDSYTPPEPPEHFGQVEYGGIWWEQEDYEAMMAEREEYLAAEQKETAEFAESIKQAQKRYEESQQQEILGYRNAERQSLIGSMDWDAEESYMLAKIAMAEAEGEDTKGKALVILTVLNRVWSDQFPDTIAEVITDDRCGGGSDGVIPRRNRTEPRQDHKRSGTDSHSSGIRTNPHYSTTGGSRCRIYCSIGTRTGGKRTTTGTGGQGGSLLPHERSKRCIQRICGLPRR